MKKGVIFVVVLGIAIVLSILALTAIYLMTNEARIAEHKIKRTRAIYAARAGLIYALERLRREGTTQDVINNIRRGAPQINGFQVDVNIQNRGQGNCPANIPSDFCVSATVNY